MKWGGKKSENLSSSPTSIMSHVFPTSWLSKFKKKGGISDPFGTQNRGSELFFASPKSEGGFYDIDEDDAYWSREKSQGGRRSTGGIKINPLWDDSYNDLTVRVASFNSEVWRKMNEVRGEEECMNFSSMVSDLKSMKGSQEDSIHYPTEVRKGRNSRNGITREEKTGVDKGGHMKEDVWKLAESNSRKQQKIQNIGPNSVKEDSKESVSCGEKVMGDGRYKELRIKTNRLKAHPPRTEFKIRALEEMKKRRMKWNDETVFDSFAVVKNSFDLQQDFRDSMVEMIKEIGIYRPEELEELLVCYLTLNRDEYHGLIINVFKEVLLELNQKPVNPGRQNGRYFVD